MNNAVKHLLTSSSTHKWMTVTCGSENRAVAASR